MIITGRIIITLLFSTKKDAISKQQRQMLGLAASAWHLSIYLTYIYFKIIGKDPKQSGINLLKPSGFFMYHQV
jgi:cytochrome b561